MNDQKPPELFAERPIRSDFARANSSRRGPSYAVRRFITLFIICVIISGGLYWKFGKASVPSAPEEIPTIKADGSYKQRPEQPGGIDIPHQDVQVYQSLDAKGPPKDQVEHLLPPPETPQSAIVPQAAKTTSVATPPDIESLIAPPAKIETTATQTPIEVVAAPTSLEPAPVASPAPAVGAAAISAAPFPTVTPAKAVPIAVTPKTIATASQPAHAEPSLSQVIKNVTASAPAAMNASTEPTAVTATNGNTAIQLASLPDQAIAKATMAKLQTQYASTLGATQLRLVKADLGAKGVYYRIQSQPVAQARAKSLCAAIKANKAGCILVRP